MTDTPRPRVYEYLAHGAFLADMIRWMSDRHRYMSMRWAARRLGMSHGTLSKVANGKRCLAEDKASELAKLLYLDEHETEYFELLVAKDSAVTQAAQAHLERLVVGRRRVELANPLGDGHGACMEDWLVPVVLEQMGMPGAVADPEVLAPPIRPETTPARVSEALEILRRTGLLPDEDGVVRTNSTGHTTDASGADYHRQMITLGAESIERWSPDARFVSGFTASVSPQLMVRLRKQICELIESMLDQCDRDEAPDRVIQLNVQLFPMTTTDDA